MHDHGNVATAPQASEAMEYSTCAYRPQYQLLSPTTYSPADGSQSSTQDHHNAAIVPPKVADLPGIPSTAAPPFVGPFTTIPFTTIPCKSSSELPAPSRPAPTLAGDEPLVQDLVFQPPSSSAFSTPPAPRYRVGRSLRPSSISATSYSGQDHVESLSPNLAHNDIVMQPTPPTVPRLARTSSFASAIPSIDPCVDDDRPDMRLSPPSDVVHGLLSGADARRTSAAQHFQSPLSRAHPDELQSPAYRYFSSPYSRLPYLRPLECADSVDGGPPLLDSIDSTHPSLPTASRQSPSTLRASISPKRCADVRASLLAADSSTGPNFFAVFPSSDDGPRPSGPSEPLARIDTTIDAYALNFASRSSVSNVLYQSADVLPQTQTVLGSDTLACGNQGQSHAIIETAASSAHKDFDCRVDESSACSDSDWHRVDHAIATPQSAKAAGQSSPHLPVGSAGSMRRSASESSLHQHNKLFDSVYYHGLRVPIMLPSGSRGISPQVQPGLSVDTSPHRAAPAAGRHASADSAHSAVSLMLSSSLSLSTRTSASITPSADAPVPMAWKRGVQIGEGSFGKVYRGMNTATGSY